MKVIHSKNHSDATEYDLEVCVLVHYSGAYKTRLEKFKRLGLYNTSGPRVHVTLLGSTDEWNKRSEILAGWPEGLGISLLAVDAVQPIPKLHYYYTRLPELNLQTRWFLRVDDDSMTDVGGLIEYFDRHYGDSVVHAMTSPYFNDYGMSPFVEYLKENKIKTPPIAHEHESSLTSQAAMQKLFSNHTALKFLEDTSEYVYYWGDQTLAVAMLICGVPLSTNPVSSKHFDSDRLAITGGNLMHIHYVNWDDPFFSIMADAYLHGTRSSMNDFDFTTLVDTPFLFGRCVGKNLAEIVLLADGGIMDSYSDNEARWKVGPDSLMFTRPDELVTTIFNTVLTHKHRCWLLGPHLLQSSMHFLRIK